MAAWVACRPPLRSGVKHTRCPSSWFTARRGFNHAESVTCVAPVRIQGCTPVVAAKSGHRPRRRDVPPSCVDSASRFFPPTRFTEMSARRGSKRARSEAGGLQARHVLSGALPPAPWVSRRRAWNSAPVASDHGSPGRATDAVRFYCQAVGFPAPRRGKPCCLDPPCVGCRTDRPSYLGSGGRPTPGTHAGGYALSGSPLCRFTSTGLTSGLAVPGLRVPAGEPSRDRPNLGARRLWTAGLGPEAVTIPS